MSGGLPVPGAAKLPIDAKADVKVRCKALRGPAWRAFGLYPGHAASKR
jgi:hypothetical protein